MTAYRTDKSDDSDRVKTKNVTKDQMRIFGMSGIHLIDMKDIDLDMIVEKKKDILKKLEGDSMYCEYCYTHDIFNFFKEVKI